MTSGSPRAFVYNSLCTFANMDLGGVASAICNNVATILNKYYFKIFVCRSHPNLKSCISQHIILYVYVRKLLPRDDDSRE